MSNNYPAYQEKTCENILLVNIRIQMKLVLCNLFVLSSVCYQNEKQIK